MLSVNFLSAQKMIKKSLVDASIDVINIDVSNCFKMKVETNEGEEMILEATIDGEYRKDLLLNIKKEASTLRVNSGFTPNFKMPNDKLSAHKVISIALKISVPRYKNVSVYGTSCNVEATGNYRNLKITLNDGTCSLDHVSESVSVLTQSGNIHLNTASAEITAESKYGQVLSEIIPKGNNRYSIATITGDIVIKKTE